MRDLKIRIPKIEITQERFFKIGMWCFFIIAMMNILNFFYTIKYHNIFTVISSWASIIFNLALVGFFYYLYSQTTPQITEEYADNSIDDLIKQIKEEENDKHTRNEKKVRGDARSVRTSKKRQKSKTRKTK